jgi:hypothetical protein
MATSDTKSQEPRAKSGHEELEAAHRFLDGFSVRRELGGGPLSIEERLRLLLGEEQPTGIPGWTRKAGTVEERLSLMEMQLEAVSHYVASREELHAQRVRDLIQRIDLLQAAQSQPSPWVGRWSGSAPAELISPPPFLRYPFSR